jgi:signal transduction histidine kinase
MRIDTAVSGQDARLVRAESRGVRRHDGEYRWVIDTGVPRYDENGSFAGYIGSTVDVTERKLATEALSTVSQRLIEAQENERAHVARELHDHAISHRLHPPRLEYLGIAEAADALCREVSSQQGIDVSFAAAAVPERLSKRVVLCLYRVLQ